MKKTISILLMLLLLMSLSTNFVLAGETDSSYGIDQIKQNMKGIGDAEDLADSGTGRVINSVIGILQMVGSGISLIVITLLGIKYVLASPSEKADVKKNILPIVIGCILLFAAVNIVGMIETFSNNTLPVSGT